MVLVYTTKHTDHPRCASPRTARTRGGAAHGPGRRSTRRTGPPSRLGPSRSPPLLPHLLPAPPEGCHGGSVALNIGKIEASLTASPSIRPSLLAGTEVGGSSSGVGVGAAATGATVWAATDARHRLWFFDLRVVVLVVRPAAPADAGAPAPPAGRARAGTVRRACAALLISVRANSATRRGQGKRHADDRPALAAIAYPADLPGSRPRGVSRPRAVQSPL